MPTAYKGVRSKSGNVPCEWLRAFMPSWENTLLSLLVSPRPSVWIPELSLFPEQDTSPNTRYQNKLCPPFIKNNSVKIALVEWLGVYLHRSPRYSDFAFRRLEYYHRLESDCYSNSYIRVAKCFRFALHHKRKPLFSSYFLTKKNWGLLWPYGFKAGVVTQACNPSMWEVETGGLEIYGQPWLHSDMVSLNIILAT